MKTLKVVNRKIIETMIVDLNQVVDALEDCKMPIDELLGFAVWRIEQVIGELLKYVKEEK